MAPSIPRGEACGFFIFFCILALPMEPIDHDKGMRRTHYTLAVLHVLCFLAVSLLMHVGAFHASLFIVTAEGFVGLMAGLFVGALATALESHGATNFRVGPRIASMLLWCSVASLLFVAVNVASAAILYVRGDMESASVAMDTVLARLEACKVAQGVGHVNTSDSSSMMTCMELAPTAVAPLVLHAMHLHSSLSLVIALIVLVVIGGLHVTTMIVYAPLVSAYTRSMKSRSSSTSSIQSSPRHQASGTTGGLDVMIHSTDAPSTAPSGVAVSNPLGMTATTNVPIHGQTRARPAAQRPAQPLSPAQHTSTGAGRRTFKMPNH